MDEVMERFYEREFWSTENLRFSQPYFRLEKLARIVNRFAEGKNCNLLDVGCGPATLANLLEENIKYFGIDIALREPASNLQELDIIENEIEFAERSFDIIVASGFFEYVGKFQRQKLYEISKVLKNDGKFVVTYGNLRRYRDQIPSVWNNVESIEDFKKDLKAYFHMLTRNYFLVCSKKA